MSQPTTPKQTRDRLALLALLADGDLPVKAEVDAFAELAKSGVFQEFEAAFGPVPRTLDGWYSLLGSIDEPGAAALLADGKMRPRDVLAYVAKRLEAKHKTTKPPKPRQKGSAARRKEERQRKAWRLHRQGRCNADIALELDVSESLISNYLKTPPPTIS